MKKGLIYIAVIAFAALAVVSCKKDEDPEVSLLVGRWEQADDKSMWVYTNTAHKDGGNLGYTWNPEDDVLESEAQKFSWTLNGSTLMQLHDQEMLNLVATRAVPKEYTITTLTQDKLVYADKFKSYTFNRKQ